MILERLGILVVCMGISAKIAIGQTYGCTDFRANNYNPGATNNDGSCTYASTSGSPVKLVDKLSDTINETSALINLNGELWTLGDSGNKNELYHFDKTTGGILQTLIISNAANVDWEELAADANHIYIGDFGNNSGSRKDLGIYKISRSQLSAQKLDSVNAEKISFNYSDQVDFTVQNNANSFDCEAMFVWNDTLHLLSKDWVNGRTKHYRLPTSPGTYSIAPLDSLDVAGLITGAAFDTSSRRIVLTCYTKSAFCHLWMLWDFAGGNTFGGNKRKIDIGFFTNTGQIEGICFSDSGNIYFTNEKYIVNNRLHALGVGLWMDPQKTGIDYRRQGISGLELYPAPAFTMLHLKYALQRPGTVSYCIYNTEGKLVSCLKMRRGGGNVEEHLDISTLAKGTYYILVHSEDQHTGKKLFIKQ
jgi:hypothetical protein